MSCSRMHIIALFCSKQPDLRRGHFLQQPAFLYSLFLNKFAVSLSSDTTFNLTHCLQQHHWLQQSLKMPSFPSSPRQASQDAPDGAGSHPARAASPLAFRHALPPALAARSTHVGGSADPFQQLNSGSFLTPASGSKLLSAGLRRSCPHDTEASRRRLAS